MHAIWLQRLATFVTPIALLFSGCSLIMDDFSGEKGCSTDGDCKPEDRCEVGVCGATGECSYEPTTFPGTEGPDNTCDNDVDDDCDGLTDEDDPECTECEPGDECPVDDDPCTEAVCNLDTGRCQQDLVPRPGEEGEDVTCGNGLDDDCDTLTDAADPDCHECEQDEECEDRDPCTDDACIEHFCHYEPVIVAGPEGPFGHATCDDEMDNDCDGFTDAWDDECHCAIDQDCTDSELCTADICEPDGICLYDWRIIPGAEGTEIADSCTDNVDNDCDTLTDADDPDCITCVEDVDCEDFNECTTDTCPAGTCSNEALPDGAPCGEPGCFLFTCQGGRCEEDGPADADGDGFLPEACGGLDCDDDDFEVNPDAPEDCTNEDDNDCDGFTGASDLECGPALCNQHGFCWENPRPVGNLLRAVWGLPTGPFWAVGKRGTVVHFDGTGWEIQETDTTEDLRDIWGTSANTAIIVGDSGAILRWTGDHWGSEFQVTARTLRSIWGSGAGDVWVVGNDGAILEWTVDHWAQHDSHTTEHLRDVRGNGSLVWAVGDKGVAVRKDGATWEIVDLGGDYTEYTFHAVWVDPDGDVWIAGDKGTILEQRDGGWVEHQLLLYTQAFHELWMESSGRKLYAASSTGSVWVHDPDTGWEEQKGSGHPLYGIWGVNAYHVLAVGEAGSLMRWDGRSLMPLARDSRAGLRAIHGRGNESWAVGDEGAALWRQGERWKEAGAGPGDTLRGVWVGLTEVWAVGDHHTVLRRTGPTWSPGAICEQIPQTASIQDVWGYDNDERYFVTGDAEACVFRAGSGVPIFWDIGNGVLELRSVWGPAPGWAWAVGAYAGAGAVGKLSEDDVTEFPFHAEGSQALNDIWGVGGDFALTVGGGGAVFVFQGQAWASVDTDSARSIRLGGVWGTSELSAIIVGDIGTVLAWDGESALRLTSGTHLALRAVWAGESGTYWIAGEDGAVLRYTP